MKTKIVYQTINGVYIGETTANESPLEPGKWHIPAGCVELEPPICSMEQYQVWDNGWTIHDIPKLPVPPEPTKEEKEAQRVAGIKAELDVLDRKSIRAIRAINAGLDVPADNVELVELEVQAKALRLSLGT